VREHEADQHERHGFACPDELDRERDDERRNDRRARYPHQRRGRVEHPIPPEAVAVAEAEIDVAEMDQPDSRKNGERDQHRVHPATNSMHRTRTQLSRSNIGTVGPYE
jgi:hypothetical protein